MLRLDGLQVPSMRYICYGRIMKLIIYSTPTCAYCKQTKIYLDKKNVPYEERSALTAPEYPELANKYGFSVPLVYNGSTGFVGWQLDKLNAMIA